MKRLVLLRHAKSSWDAPVSRDFDRPLSKRGKRAGKAMGRYLLAQKITWDVMLVSPALRTMETVERLEVGYGKALDPLYDDRLYMASTNQLLAMVRGLDDEGVSSAVIVGHNPGIQGLALALTPGGDDADKARARLDAKFPTAALAVLEFSAKRWADIAPGSGALERFIKPKDLKHEDGDSP